VFFPLLSLKDFLVFQLVVIEDSREISLSNDAHEDLLEGSYVPSLTKRLQSLPLQMPDAQAALLPRHKLVPFSNAAIPFLGRRLNG